MEYTLESIAKAIEKILDSDIAPDVPLAVIAALENAYDRCIAELEKD